MQSGATISVGRWPTDTSDNRSIVVSHMSIIRHAFAGVPTLTKEVVSQAEMEAAVSTSDFL